MWIDTHCHLDASEVGLEADSIAGSAEDLGVSHIVIPAVARGNFDSVAALAAQNANCRYALGIHPIFVPDAQEEDLGLLRRAVEAAMDDPRFVAVGEIGLDFFVPGLGEGGLRDKQEYFYGEQLKIARDFDLPVLLHVRRSQDVILKHLRRIRVHGGIAHAFNGSFQQANEFLRLGFRLGFGGAMTFTRALQIRRLASELPLDAIVLETDAPDISPAWIHPQRNSPEELPRIGDILAQLRGLAPEQVAHRQMRGTYCRDLLFATERMRAALLGFVIGACLLQSQPSLLSRLILSGLFLFSLLLFSLARRREHLVRGTLLLAGGTAFGFAWACAVADYRLVEELPREWEGRDVTIIGTVDSLPATSEHGTHFNFAVEKVLENGPVIPKRLALSWYSGWRVTDRQEVPRIAPGERWRLTVRLRRPHGNANPMGFDYEVWLLEQGLRATGAVRTDGRPGQANERLTPFVFSAGNVVERCREWLRDRIEAALPGKQYTGVIVALVIGDQRSVERDDWKVFTRTGIGHLISISGLHITMVAGLFAGLIGYLWRRSFFTQAELPLRLPAQKAAAAAGAGVALIYVLLAGFGVPAQRTLYMLTIVAIALWTGRIASLSHVLCAALGWVVLLDPWAVLWPGFWLSFGAVAVILYASIGRIRKEPAATTTVTGAAGSWRTTLAAAVHTQYVVTIGLVPLTMLLFGQVSLVSPVANAAAIPLVSFFVTPLALAGSVMPAPLSGWVLMLAHFLIEQLAHGLEWLSRLDFAVWSAPVPPWWMFSAALLGTLWMLAPAGWPVRWLGAVGLAPLVLNVPAHPREGEMWVTAFDIGQGNALLVETANRRLLYDTGPAYSADSDAGSRVILPYLAARGIDRIDGMVVSHSDADHSGGALAILDGIKVGWVASSLPVTHPIVAASPRHIRCVAGQSWQWDQVRFDMLHPAPVSYESMKWKPNARSCTLRITLAGHAVLLAGDIEAVQEAELVEGRPQDLRADVLLAPHHGSGTSSTPAFLQTVRPEWALFQVGYLNRYRHPKPEVYERYGALGIRRLRSDEAGAVTLRFGATLDVSAYRSEHARYWYGR